ncbi:S16 family serine protease [Nocardioides sp. InS609-2]|uniref:YlbL family protein n=1 Tax=Nocardioides sp. InS609-2 TaxID=2760705 RepID=UPI0020BE3EEC|nr:S16 family serine protease [Nocardioides sp. InS609-2]
MTQRTLAGILAVPLLVVLWVVALTSGLPYVTYQPGVTVDVLGAEDGKEIVQVSGHKTYRDEGQLRMTTVYVTRPQSTVNLFEATSAWVSRDDAVVPYDAVYAPDETQEDSKTESAVEMVSSQDSAVASALTELGYDITPVIEVLNVGEGLPAAGKLEVRDVLLKIGETTIKSGEDVVTAVRAAPVNQPLPFVVRRGDEERTIDITPKKIEGETRVGITPGPGFDFPFQVSVNIDPTIGGPSAGLLFSLGIYDTLTPGSLTDDEIVAGTGTIDETGKVGPIGGIPQKIAASREAGAKLFLVPIDNCKEADKAPRGDMRLAVVATMHEAVQAIDTWTAGHDAPLPTCPKEAAQ